MLDPAAIGEMAIASSWRDRVWFRILFAIFFCLCSSSIVVRSELRNSIEVVTVDGGPNLKRAFYPAGLR